MTDPVLLVVHGPNLNLLGTREPEVYGTTTLEEINTRLEAAAKEAGVSLQILQTNHEGVASRRVLISSSVVVP